MTTAGLEVRADFPQLERLVEGQRILYLDSAATALKPRVVIDAMVRYYSEFSANIHRGRHRLSEEASEAYERARDLVGQTLNVGDRAVIFTRNCTDGINLVAEALGIGPQRRVIAARTEHHSNLLPWVARGALDWVEVGQDGLIDPGALRRAAGPLTRLFSVGHVSNLTGAIQPLRALVEEAHRLGLWVHVDAAQSVPHLKVDVEAVGADLLTFSGHKVLGPTGVGVLIGRRELLEVTPARLGGGTVLSFEDTSFRLKESPWRYEAGTPHIAGAIGLAEALRYLDRLGEEPLARHEARLAAAMLERFGALPGLRVLGPDDPAQRVSLVSLVLAGPLTADQVATILSDRHQIYVRSGSHCCQPWLSHLGVEAGALRFSAYLYNTVEEIDEAAQTLGAVLRQLGAS
jgi:cysteine desulfurase / selenocysteine lyase